MEAKCGFDSSLPGKNIHHTDREMFAPTRSHNKTLCRDSCFTDKDLSLLFFCVHLSDSGGKTDM